jgi:hypothetical protein
LNPSETLYAARPLMLSVINWALVSITGFELRGPSRPGT